MPDTFVTLEENRKVNAKYYKLAFRCADVAGKARPGQFMNIRIQSALDPFLRRPFSFCRVQGDRVEVLYEVLGRGTSVLAQKKRGDVLQVLGPLGRPFSAGIGNKKRVLVAGGVGIPPLLFIAEREKTEYLFIGAKERGEVLPDQELSGVCANVRYATNDGSYGPKGYVTVLLERLLEKCRASELFIQTCGPKPMIQAVMALAAEYRIEGEASLDEAMACGIGACLGCVVRAGASWKTSCKDGPVFSFAELSS